MSVARLLSVTEGLDAPRIFERSIKLHDGHVATDRGLVSLDKRALYPGPRTTLANTCTALGCPDTSALEPHLSRAHSVHFGADGDIGKCYLEFTPDTAPLPHLVFLAIKWRGDDLRVNHYTSITHQPHADKQTLIDTALPEGPVRNTMHTCLTLARDGDPDDEAVVLHVTEVDTARASIDISVADANQTLADTRPLLAPLFTTFDIDADTHLTDDRFGHIAAGTDRAGLPFATLYYGATQL